MRELTMQHRDDTVRAIDAHFAGLGSAYDESAFSTPGLAWISRRELDAVSNAVRYLPRGARVLDAGAGNGRVSRMLTRVHGFAVTALDPVPEMLTATEAAAPDAMALLARLGQSLPFCSGAFDAAVAVRVLKWVPAWEHAIKELARVLAPGGLLVLEIANRRSLARLGYPGAAITLCSLREVRRVGSRAGIRWIRASPGTHLPFSCWNAARHSLVLHALAAAQGGADRLLGPRGARSVVLSGLRSS